MPIYLFSVLSPRFLNKEADIHDNPFYTPDELSMIKKARDLGELQDLARLMIFELKGRGDTRMICGPIDCDNGVKEEEKIRCLMIANERQRQFDLKIFNYIPFLKRASAILNLPCPVALFEMRFPFFYGFIHTGWIGEYYFLPSWQDSPFCQWVMDQARQERHNRKIIVWSEE